MRVVNKVKNIEKIAGMKIRSQDNDKINFCRDVEAKFTDSLAFHWRGIESAGCVPFHLIPGQQSGEGYSLDTVGGITELLGISPDDFTEKVFEVMIEKIVPISADAPEELLEAHRKILAGEINTWKVEMMIRTAAGERKWIRDVSLPQIDEETGKVTGIFGILYDITESRLTHEKVEKISQKEEEYNRLKTCFLQNISHEIRTPLNAIVGFSALIGEDPDGEDPERLKEYREIINSNSDRLLQIMDSIIEMSKIEAGTVAVTRNKANLNWILLKAYGQFRIDASAKGVLLVYKTALADREADIFTDEFKLARVLSHLVGNAVKFTDKGKIEFGYLVKETRIEFYVSDTGIGIPHEQKEAIFREFFQADGSYTRNYGGIGLGLAISKAYTGMLGGEIWFTSQPGEGSVFRVTVPYERADG